MISLVVGTAGHIDHGKSALVRALTGTDPDRLKEEKARGITIDLGFAHAEIAGVHVAFVDVPGHERFVKNMLAGVAGIDAVLLVVAADESVMPQTREHFDICRLLRVPSGVIALTRADLVDAETLELSRLETRELVAGTFLETAPIVAVSAATGAGLEDLRRALAALAPKRSRTAGMPARLPIDRVFSMKGFGTVVTGTLASGELRTNDELLVQPGGRRVKVRGLQVHGSPAESVDAGHRVAANLGGVEVADLVRGDTLVALDTLEPTRRVDAVIELLPSARALRHGTRVRFHHGTAERLGRVSIAKSLAPEDGAAPAGRDGELQPGHTAYARIRLEAPAVLARGDRFILRAYSPPITIGGGEVLDPQPGRGGVRTEAGLRRFERLRPGAALTEVAATLIAESGASGLPSRALAARAGVAPGELPAVLARLESEGIARDLGDVIVSRQTLDGLARQVMEDLEAHHRTEPLSEGLPREELRSRYFARAHGQVFEAVLDELLGGRKVAGRDRLSLATHRVALLPDEQRAFERIEEMYRRAALKPPSPSELPAALRLDASLIDRMVKLLARRRVLVKVDDLLFHAEALARLKADLAALKAAAQPATVDVGSFKEKYGITRKFAIPLLEYLDRERVTRRVGDARLVL